MHDNFRTSYTSEEIFGLHPKPDPPPKNGRTFAFFCAVAVIPAFAASLLYDSGGVFLPVWGISVLLLWSVWESRGKN